MRFLIVAAAVLACAAAAPSGALLASTYSAGFFNHGLPLVYAAAPVAVAHSVPVVASPVPTGDVEGAAIDAHVDAADNVRAAIDNAGQINDQVAEIHGKAINAAEDNAWQAVSAAQSAAAAIDGAAASIAPEAAKHVAGHAAVIAPVAAYAAHTYSAPLYPGYVNAPFAYSAPAYVRAW